MRDGENSGANPARLKLIQGIQRQLAELDGEIERLDKQRDEVRSAQLTLGQIEAILRRMSMLARRASSEVDDSVRRELSREFLECKEKIDELSKQAVLRGNNLIYGDSIQIQAMILEMYKALE